MRRPKSLVSVLLMLMLCSGAGLAEGMSSPGAQWLKLSDEARVAYIYGYIWGFQGGFTEACKVGERMWAASPKGLPGHDCILKMPELSKSPEECAKVITEYYESYPADDGVPVRRLLEGLSSPRNLTVLQLHQEYGPGARKTQTEPKR
jgi:hypothetical protein